MINFKYLGNFIFTVVAMMTMSVLLISCEQEELLEKDSEEVLIDFNDSSVTAVNLEDELFDNAQISERGSCYCTRMNTSRRSSTSSYVYCHNFARNNSDKDINYVLYRPNSNSVIQSDKYYAEFDGLTSGQTYSYRVRMYCDDGSLYVSPRIYFIQPN